MLKIWLDDVRPAPDKWIWVKSAEKLIDVLEGDYQMMEWGHSQWITEISFDHDLGENVKTGYDALKHLEEMVLTRGYPAPKLKVHSANPVGIRNMRAAITSIERYSAI